ncbi:MAG: DNA polymerase III subunit epsilon [Gemmatimonadaceae bacterium]|nr:DNA polymerase III subunit epsilon [Gemmatimonadaceae bacterium]
MLGLDFETTGVDPWNDRPVSVAIHDDPGNQTFDAVINCGVEVPAEAAAIHGLTTEIVRERGLPVENVMVWVANYLRTALQEKRPIVIMNARFDWPLLITELQRHGMADEKALSYQPVILDPSVLDRGFDKYRRGKRRLADLCLHYGVELEEAHTATADVRASVDLVRAIGRKMGADPKFAHYTLESLQMFQRKTSNEFVAFLNEGRDGVARDTPFGWPIPDRTPEEK